MAAAPVELWSTRLSCPQIHRRISSLPQQLPSATLGEPENPSLNSDPGCIKVVDTYPRVEEGAKQRIFALGQRYRCTIRIGEPSGRAVQLPTGKPIAATIGSSRRTGAPRVEPPQHGADARKQLAQIERLRQIVVGAQLEPDD